MFPVNINTLISFSIVVCLMQSSIQEIYYVQIKIATKQSPWIYSDPNKTKCSISQYSSLTAHSELFQISVDSRPCLADLRCGQTSTSSTHSATEPSIGGHIQISGCLITQRAQTRSAITDDGSSNKILRFNQGVCPKKKKKKSEKNLKSPYPSGPTQTFWKAPFHRLDPGGFLINLPM